MKERILITGASGFLGFHVIMAALAEGMEVYAAIRNGSDVRHLQQLSIKYVYLDFNNSYGIKKELESHQFHYIVHSAGCTKARTVNEYNTVNADFTYKLAMAAATAEMPLKKFVFVSSLAAIGPLQNSEGILREDSPAKPITNYGRSKLLAEQMLASVSLPLVIIRPTAIYGPREKDILLLFKAIKKGWEPYIGKQPQQLSFVFAFDVATAILKALFSPHHFGLYHITDGHCYSRYELASLAKKALSKETTIIHVPASLMRGVAFGLEKTYALFNKMPVVNSEKINELTACNWNCSIQKAQQELNFTPLFTLKEGVYTTISWYQKNRWI